MAFTTEISAGDMLWEMGPWVIDEYIVSTFSREELPLFDGSGCHDLNLSDKLKFFSTERCISSSQNVATDKLTAMLNNVHNN